jgi:hypothetical protein
VWLRDKSGELAMEQPRAIVTLDRPAKYLVNVGSVGQNRDRDPRACYTIFDTDNNVIQFRRISYDVRATQKKILAAGSAQTARLAAGARIVNLNSYGISTSRSRRTARGDWRHRLIIRKPAACIRGG